MAALVLGMGAFVAVLSLVAVSAAKGLLPSPDPAAEAETTSSPSAEVAQVTPPKRGTDKTARRRFGGGPAAAKNE